MHCSLETRGMECFRLVRRARIHMIMEQVSSKRQGRRSTQALLTWLQLGSGDFFSGLDADAGTK